MIEWWTYLYEFLKEIRNQESVIALWNNFFIKRCLYLCQISVNTVIDWNSFTVPKYDYEIVQDLNGIISCIDLLWLYDFKCPNTKRIILINKVCIFLLKCLLSVSFFLTMSIEFFFNVLLEFVCLFITDNSLVKHFPLCF